MLSDYQLLSCTSLPTDNSRMQAIVTSTAGPMLVERDIPQIQQPDDVIISVSLAGLCRTDSYLAQGLIPCTPGRVLGHEFCGMVHTKGSADSHIQIGARVGVMPIFPDGIGNILSLGKDVDGAFAEFIRVPASLVYTLPETLSDKEAAYLEPVAASLAVMSTPIQPSMYGAIYGDNRIGELTRRILSSQGFSKLDVLLPEQEISAPNSHYDFVIETSATANAFDAMITLLRPKGILVLKSRPYASVPLQLTRIVQKELQIFGAHYANFGAAIALLDARSIQLDDLLGDSFSFEEITSFLGGKKMLPENKKIFLKP